MKVIKYIAMTFFVVMALSACGYENESQDDPTSITEPLPTVEPVQSPEPAEPSPENGNMEDNATVPVQNWKGLRMYVAAGSVTPTGLRLSMINESGLNFGHGVQYRIEQYTNEGWEDAPLITNYIMWILPLISVPPYHTTEEYINWEHMHGQLPPGQYRIVRNFIEDDWNNPIPMWQRNIPEAYLYAVFIINDAWQNAYDIWQAEQNVIIAAAYARYEGLGLEIVGYSTRGIGFSLTNNNPYYTYIITGVFVGWEDIFPEGGHAGAVEYFIFGRGMPNTRWPFGDEKRLGYNEQIVLSLSWYDDIGELMPRDNPYIMSPNPSVFQLVVDVMLDVDEDYIDENFRHLIPGVPHAGHRIVAEFDIS